MAKPEVVVASALLASFVLGLIGGRWAWKPRTPRYATDESSELSTTLDPSVRANTEGNTTEVCPILNDTTGNPSTVPGGSTTHVFEEPASEQSVQNASDRTFLDNTGSAISSTVSISTNASIDQKIKIPHTVLTEPQIGFASKTDVTVEWTTRYVSSRGNFSGRGYSSNYGLNTSGNVETLKKVSIAPILRGNIKPLNVTSGFVNVSLQTTPKTNTANSTVIESVEKEYSTSAVPETTISEDVDYVKMGQELMAEAITVLDSGIWDFERRTEDGDVIFSRLANGSTVYRLTGIVDMPAQDLLVIIYDGLADYPKWNPTLLECRVLEKINDLTDISYTVSAPGARGYVASRDFVSLRHWEVYQNTYVAATKSIDFQNAPSNPDYIRGQNGAGCMELRPLSSDPYKTEFRWLLNTRLNGWIPSYIADKAYKKFMTKYMYFLREYCKKVKQRAAEALTPASNMTQLD